MPLALKYLLLLLFVLHFVPFFYFLASAIVGRMCGIPIKRFGIFHAPVLARFTCAGVPVEIGCLPLGITLEFDQTLLPTRPLWMRWMTYLSGIVAYFFLALLFLPLPDLLREVGEGFGQWWQGVFSPLDEAQKLIASGMSRADRPFREFMPLMMAKAVAVNLMICPLNLINATYATGNPSAKLPPAVQFLATSGALVMMLMSFVWFFALGVYLWRLSWA